MYSEKFTRARALIPDTSPLLPFQIASSHMDLAIGWKNDDVHAQMDVNRHILIRQ